MCLCLYNVILCIILNIIYVDWNIKNGYFVLFDFVIEGFELYVNSNIFFIKGGNVLNLKLI